MIYIKIQNVFCDVINIYKLIKILGKNEKLDKKIGAWKKRIYIHITNLCTNIIKWFYKQNECEI